MNASWVSRRTWSLLGIGALGVALVYGLSMALAGDAGVAVADVGQLAVLVVATIVVFRSALRLDVGEPLRRRWVLIGLALACFAAGDATWTYLEVVAGQEPFPSLADAFYVAGYPLLTVALVAGTVAFRFLVDIRKLFLWVFAVVVPLCGVLYFALLRLIVEDGSMDALTKAISLFYPLGDLVLLFAPALAAALALRSMGTGRLAAPWWAVVAGVGLLAVADSAFSYLDWQGRYESGNIVDIGWMCAYLLIAVGGSLTRDLLAKASASRPHDEQLAA